MPLFPNDPPQGWCHGDLDAVLHFNSTKTGVLLRRALREAFPGTRFSVRQAQLPDRWQTTLTVRWTDGPLREQVERITERFVSVRPDKGRNRLYRAMTVVPVLLGPDIVDTHPVIFGAERITSERSITAVDDEWSGVARVERSPTAESIVDIDRATFEAMVAAIRKARAQRRMGAGHERVNVKTGTEASRQMGHFVPRALNPRTPEAMEAGSDPQETARKRGARSHRLPEVFDARIDARVSCTYPSVTLRDSDKTLLSRGPR